MQETMKDNDMFLKQLEHWNRAMVSMKKPYKKLYICQKLKEDPMYCVCWQRRCMPKNGQGGAACIKTGLRQRHVNRPSGTLYIVVFYIVCSGMQKH